MALLTVVLAGLLVWAGTLSPADVQRDFPSEDDVGPDRDAYIGERVTLSGTVVETNPVIITVEYGTGESFRATLADADQSVSEGDQVSAFGTLESPSTLAVERVVVREPWELWYMYAVSFVGGLWVVARTVRRWRVDADRLAVVPREEPLQVGGDSDA